MPLPRKGQGETHSDFISRCMSDDKTVGEFPNESQRYAVCERQWRNNEVEGVANGEQVRVNIRTTVNASKIREETRDGREVYVVPSATLPDNVVMNGIRYPANEIEKSFMSLEGTPAPLGHPEVDGLFVSAKSPLGLNIGYFGAWNENVRRKDGRVYVDKIIDKERANESKMGQRVLNALKEQKPIHTSTGLLMNLEANEDDEEAKWIARNMEFDHDAILLDEEGAATPDQGVGLLVNKARVGDKQVPVINSDMTERIDQQIDYLGTELVSLMQRKEEASRWGQIKSILLDGLRAVSRGNDGDIQSQPQEATEMDEKKAEARFNALEETVEKISKTLETVNTQLEANGQQLTALNAERDAAKADLVTKVVNAKLLTEDEAKATPLPALKALAANVQSDDAPIPAPGLNGAYHGNSGAKTTLGEDWEKA